MAKRRERQSELPGAEKAQPEGVDDELVVEVHRLTEEWQAAGLTMREARATLLDQLAAAGLEEYETHDGYRVERKVGKDKLSVTRPKGAKDPDA